MTGDLVTALAMSLRIIGGVWRSRRLIQPRTKATRPMPDRVKQAIFDNLGCSYGTLGALPALRVADVFAGSGSMGLEAMSRGAECCCFFERNREALAALRENVSSVNAGAKSIIVSKDAWRFAFNDPNGRNFDLVFLDPPYRDSGDTSTDGKVFDYLQRLTGGGMQRPQVVLHHSSRARFSVDARWGWSILDERIMGSSAVTRFG